MNRPLVMTITSTTAVAVLGNAFVDSDDLDRLAQLRSTRKQLPIPAFAVVGALYYVVMGVVLYRATDCRDRLAPRLALVVLTLNEVWNVGFFWRRSVANGFFGMASMIVREPAE